MTSPVWPPALADLKDDLRIPLDNERDDAALQRELNAAVAEVQRVRPDLDYTADPMLLDTVPRPDWDVVLGTIRLAGRWHTRRRSPDGLVAMGELGTARVPSFDPDIERLLKVGRYQDSSTA